MAAADPSPGDLTAEAGRVRTWWLWLVVIPFGGGAWVPSVAGFRAGDRRWVLLGLLMFALAFGGFVMVGVSEDDHWLEDVGVGVTLLGWLASIGFVAATREQYRLKVALARRSLVADTVRSAKQDERDAALRLAASDPAEALLQGVGRPDLPDARHGHVVDLNHAPASVLATLPGIDAETAGRLVATREAVGLFASVDDACFVLDLPADVVPRLRRVAVALRDLG